MNATPQKSIEIKTLTARTASGKEEIKSIVKAAFKAGMLKVITQKPGTIPRHKYLIGK